METELAIVIAHYEPHARLVQDRRNVGVNFFNWLFKSAENNIQL
jgi:hypothetical protein